MRYASRIDRLEDKTLLNAMEMAKTKETISFSAGFPSSESYPVEDIKASFVNILEQEGKNALSYCATSGNMLLREILGKRMSSHFDLQYELDEIIITSGSQQGLDMSGMLFVNRDDVVIFESPCYLGAVNALRAHEAELVSVPSDEEGIELAALQRALDSYGDRVKMIYVIPDFQNPTGRSWSEERRKAFADLVSEYDVAVLEDAAYAELSFRKINRKPLCYYDRKGQIIYIGTFSKTFCPGLRVAWLCARREIMEKYLVLKNAADLSSSAICQMLMAHYLSHYDLDAHIAKTIKNYERRKDAMVAAIRKEFPAEVHFTEPEGGLFLWLALPETKNARELLRRCLKAGVSFIPGDSFYPAGGGNHELRLNFSNVEVSEIAAGISIMGKMTKEYFAE